jgi:hypothetical protein
VEPRRRSLASEKPSFISMWSAAARTATASVSTGAATLSRRRLHGGRDVRARAVTRGRRRGRDARGVAPRAAASADEKDSSDCCGDDPGHEDDSKEPSKAMGGYADTAGALVDAAGDVVCPIDESAFGAPPWDPANGDDPISNETLLKIVLSQVPDREVNELVWEALGYVKSIELDMETLEGEEVWSPDNVFPKWKAAYPEPPDVIGVRRKYWPEIDAPVKAACAALTRSVAEEHKAGIKTTLRHYGWKGFRMDGLTPNMTRRAQVANWLLYYRRELRGVSIEELKRRREERRKREEAENKTAAPTGTTKQGVV